MAAAPLPSSSGNFAADRRLAVAEAYLAQGDATAAIDLLQQALEIAPGWAAGWFRLGEMLEQRPDATAEAVDAFRTAARLDPRDALGAAARLARLMPDDPEGRMSEAYVATLFDQYAARFDEHLVGKLVYRGPQIMVEALAEACARLGRPFRFDAALDLGCGTGLMARAVRAHVDVIDGVDLSPEMVRHAAATGLYRRVWVGELMEAIRASPAPLLLAADVLCYVKDLNQPLNAAAQAIPLQGLFAFTLQMKEGEGVAMGHDLRYHHSESYVREAAAAAGLSPLHLASCVTRRDGDRDVPGLIVVLGKADGG